MIVVELGHADLVIAIEIAKQRHTGNVAAGRRERYGAGGNLFKPHYIGALGEVALAKHLNVYYNGSLGNLGAADVGGYQIRSTDRPDGCLIVHDEDSDAHEIWLAVVNGSSNIKLFGPGIVRECKLRRWFRSDLPRPAYFVPQSAFV